MITNALGSYVQVLLEPISTEPRADILTNQVHTSMHPSQINHSCVAAAYLAMGAHAGSPMCACLLWNSKL